MPLTHEFVVLGPGTRPLAARDRALPPRVAQGIVASKYAPGAPPICERFQSSWNLTL